MNDNELDLSKYAIQILELDASQLWSTCIFATKLLSAGYKEWQQELNNLITGRSQQKVETINELNKKLLRRVSDWQKGMSKPLTFQMFEEALAVNATNSVLGLIEHIKSEQEARSEQFPQPLGVHKKLLTITTKALVKHVTEHGAGSTTMKEVDEWIALMNEQEIFYPFFHASDSGQVLTHSSDYHEMTESIRVYEQWRDSTNNDVIGTEFRYFQHKSLFIHIAQSIQHYVNAWKSEPMAHDYSTTEQWQINCSKLFSFYFETEKFHGLTGGVNGGSGMPFPHISNLQSYLPKEDLFGKNPPDVINVHLHHLTVAQNIYTSVETKMIKEMLTPNEQAQWNLYRHTLESTLNYYKERMKKLSNREKQRRHSLKNKKPGTRPRRSFIREDMFDEDFFWLGKLSYWHITHIGFSGPTSTVEPRHCNSKVQAEIVRLTAPLMKGLREDRSATHPRQEGKNQHQSNINQTTTIPECNHHQQDHDNNSSITDEWAIQGVREGTRLLHASPTEVATENSIVTAAAEEDEAEFQQNFQKDIANIQLSHLTVYNDYVQMSQKKRVSASEMKKGHHT